MESNRSNKTQTVSHPFPSLNTHILGIGVEYPSHEFRPNDLREFALKHNPKTPALEKILFINENTGIDMRNTVLSVDDPLVNQVEPPSNDQISKVLLTEGVQLAANGARKAIAEWGGSASDITHVVSVTSMNTSSPGFDHYVAQELGLKSNVQRALLHGVGCAGGLAALRTAANLAVASTFLQQPARILVLACDLPSMMYRSELDSITKTQQTLIGVTLFSDCASAMIVSNGVGEDTATAPKPIYEILGWDNVVVPGTGNEMGMKAHTYGWKGVLSPRVPFLATASVGPVLSSLLPRVPSFKYTEPEEFDWALHPGGLKIITGVQKELCLKSDHLRASYDIYKNRGNSSGPTVMNVLSRLREPDMQKNGRGKENVIACAFGPGLTVEMVALRRVAQS